MLSRGHCVPCARGRPALFKPGTAANGAGTLLSRGRRLMELRRELRALKRQGRPAPVAAPVAALAVRGTPRKKRKP